MNKRPIARIYRKTDKWLKTPNVVKTEFSIKSDKHLKKDRHGGQKRPTYAWSNVQRDQNVLKYTPAEV
jgi:hypothetical protein